MEYKTLKGRKERKGGLENRGLKDWNPDKFKES